MDRIYMNCGSASPVTQSVIRAMRPYLKTAGNPSSITSWGTQAKRSIDKARQKVADLVSAENPREIIFTSGATEANNLAILGTAREKEKKGNHIIVSSIEHISVVSLCKSLEKQGFDITYIPIDSDGLIDPKNIQKAITEKTILISIMYANGEIGTIEPIADIGQIAKEHGVAFHVDGTAACGKIPVNVVGDNIDMLTISSNDLFGPQGTGALYVRQGVRIKPIMFGGGQERKLRSGTENVASIIGMGKAAQLAVKDLDAFVAHVNPIRDRLLDGLTAEISETYVTGSRKKRLPNHASVRFNYIEGESIILNLDLMGIAAASGSACTSKTLEASHVLLSLGLKHEEVHGSLVFTLSQDNKIEQADYVVKVLPGIVDKLRAMSPLTPG